jgi:hypothetical protein
VIEWRVPLFSPVEKYQHKAECERLSALFLATPVLFANMNIASTSIIIRGEETFVAIGSEKRSVEPTLHFARDQMSLLQDPMSFVSD